MLTGSVNHILIAVTLDIAFTWKARHTLSFYQKLRFALKFCICGIWAITLPTAYSTSQRNSVCSTKLSQSNLYLFCLSPYMIVVAIYLISNVVGMTLFFFPAVITYIEISNWRICKLLSWWAQVSSPSNIHLCMISSQYQVKKRLCSKDMLNLLTKQLYEFYL